MNIIFIFSNSPPEDFFLKMHQINDFGKMNTKRIKYCNFSNIIFQTIYTLLKTKAFKITLEVLHSVANFKISQNFSAPCMIFTNMWRFV